MIARTLSLVALVIVTPAAVRADELKSFPAAMHGKGELRYVEKVPVLILRGTPAEMGEQFGVLAIRNAPDLVGLHNQFLKDANQEAAYPIILGMARQLRPNFPPNHLAELEAAANARFPSPL